MPDVNFPSWMETLLKDLRYASRQFVRNPVFTLVAVASLAVGIGANTAIFSVMNAALLKSLPVRDPQDLVEETKKSEAPNALLHTLALCQVNKSAAGTSLSRAAGVPNTALAELIANC